MTSVVRTFHKFLATITLGALDEMSWHSHRNDPMSFVVRTRNEFVA